MRAGEPPVAPESSGRVQVTGPIDPWRIWREATTANREAPPVQRDYSVGKRPDSIEIGRYRTAYEFSVAEHHPEIKQVSVLTVQRTGWPFWNQPNYERISMVIPPNSEPKWIVLGQVEHDRPQRFLSTVGELRGHQSYQVRVPLRGRWTHCPESALTLANPDLVRSFRTLRALSDVKAAENFASMGLLGRAAFASAVNACTSGTIGWHYGWTMDVLPYGVIWGTKWKISSPPVQPGIFGVVRPPHAHGRGGAWGWDAFDYNVLDLALNAGMDTGPPEPGGEEGDEEEAEEEERPPYPGEAEGRLGW